MLEAFGGEEAMGEGTMVVQTTRAWQTTACRPVFYGLPAKNGFLHF